MRQIKTPNSISLDPLTAVVLVAVALTPFEFLQLPVVNFGPSDLIFVVVFSVITLGGKKLILFPSKGIGAGVLLFLLGAGLSLSVTPLPLEGLLDYLQYILIFVVVVPVVLTVLRKQGHRWVATLLLWVVLNFITIAATIQAVNLSIMYLESHRTLLTSILHMQLWYGNQNVLYWSLGASTIMNFTIVLDRSIPQRLRYIALSLLIPSAFLVLIGRSLSAILMIGTAGWLASFLYIQREGERSAFHVFLGLTAVATGVVVIIIIIFLDYFIQLGNVEGRLFMYSTAIRIGTQAFPLGTGLESSWVVLEPFAKTGVKTIHNFALAYYLETGIIGVTGFLVVLGFWFRDIVLAHLRHLRDLCLYETAPVLIFIGYFFVILFQNVPVDRFWWVMWALSCSTIFEARVQ